MTTVALTAVPRSDFGKGAARRTRRSGSTPAVIYGEGTELLRISFDTHELELALRKPRVVLNVTVDGKELLTKPRDVQREPVKRYLEHVDLIVITKVEANRRSQMADAIKAAHRAADEAGIDAGAVIQFLEAAVEAGEAPLDAVEHAVADAQAQAAAYAEAARASEAAAEAKAEAAAEGEPGEPAAEPAAE